MKDKTMTINTERLSLRSLLEKDRENLISIFYDESVTKTYMIPVLEKREQADKLFDRLKELSEDATSFLYGICYEDEAVGFLNKVDVSGDVIEVGYVITPQMQGRGFATEALRAAISELFSIGYNTVRAGFFEENIASKRVMEKSGMHLIDMTEDIEYRDSVHHCIYYEISK